MLCTAGVFSQSTILSPPPRPAMPSSPMAAVASARSRCLYAGSTHARARVVARAWVDPAYKQRLLADATAAIGELGIAGRGGGDKMVLCENTPAVHNMVVCTLCSCYPW